MGKFTPGPWVEIVNRAFNDVFIYECGNEGIHIATTMNCEKNINEANARLIAAAPDMAEEIERLKEQKETMYEALIGFLHDMDIYGAPKRETVRDGYSAVDFVKGDKESDE